MCGICGQFNFGNGAPVSASTIEAMMGTIIHRGPDDAGRHLDRNLGLGFRRLAIIDLSPAGHQPMSDQAQTVWVVFNGEIYNYQKLRQELQGHGHVFRSNCDTEVIVHGYKQWGDAALNRFNGMFGLAIWDVKKRRLLLARDPMGIKPVYYAIRNGSLAFGSEIRPVRVALGEPGVDPEAVALFLRYRYTPAPRTMFKGIQKLAAGEKLVVENGQVHVSRYYQFVPEPFAPQPRPEEAAEKLIELYRAAMKRHLISDVPLGLLLSGGLDSGLLLALMSSYGRDWHTFSIGYGSSFADDELEDAGKTARTYGAKHNAVHLTRETFEDVLPRIVDVLEEPVASSSIVPMYFVCQRARENVKVALIGQGPDELFGGYNRHLGVHYGAAWRALPAWLQTPSAALARALPRNDTIKRGLYSLHESDRLRRFQQIFSLVSDDAMQGLFRPELIADGEVAVAARCWEEYRPAFENLDDLSAFQLLELRSSLPDELLMYGDKLSMAHALEVRVPYLDREVVEHVQQLGASFKVRHGIRKWLHREVSKRLLSSEIIHRKKRGFAVNVVDGWFRQSLDGGIRQYLADPQSQIYRFLEPAAVQSMLRDHAAGRADHHKMLFSIVVLEQWLRSVRLTRRTRCPHPVH